MPSDTTIRSVEARLFAVPLPEVMTDAMHGAHTHFDLITATVRLAALDQKEGRKGPFVRQVRETTFVNQFGTEVARSRMIGIAR